MIVAPYPPDSVRSRTPCLITGSPALSSPYLPPCPTFPAGTGSLLLCYSLNSDWCVCAAAATSLNPQYWQVTASLWGKFNPGRRHQYQCWRQHWRQRHCGSAARPDRQIMWPDWWITWSDRQIMWPTISELYQLLQWFRYWGSWPTRSISHILSYTTTSP